MDNLEKYLPSKKFIASFLVIVILVSFFFTIKGVFVLFKDKKVLTNKGQQTQVAVGALIQQDSNSNGIPDWEEYLWGLNPKINGESNQQFILSKKTALAKSGDMVVSDDSQKITDNEILSQQLFATLVSLQQTGQLDDNALKTINESISKNAIAVDLSDVYSSSMLKVTDDSEASKKAYFDALQSLIKKYQGYNIGDELTIIIQGLSNKDASALYAASTIGDAYRLFGKDFAKIPVPKSLADTHLSVANNYEKVGQSIIGLTKMLTDPMLSMKAIINYKKYSEELSSGLDKISSALQ